MLTLAPAASTFDVMLVERPAPALAWIEAHIGTNHHLRLADDGIRSVTRWRTYENGALVDEEVLDEMWAAEHDVIVRTGDEFNALSHSAFCAIFGSHQWARLVNPTTQEP